MLEAQRRGHRVLYVELQRGVGVDEWSARGRGCDPGDATPAEQGRHAELGDARQLVIVEDDGRRGACSAPIRPVDAEPTSLVDPDPCAPARRALVLNRPQGILTANEKLYALHFARPHAVDTMVSRLDPPSSIDFMAKSLVRRDDHQAPRRGREAKGIFHRSETTTGISVVDPRAVDPLRDPARHGPALSPRGAAEATSASCSLDGEAHRGAACACPQSAETRANLHVGGRRRCGPSSSDTDRRIHRAHRARVLRRDGLFFVGIDVIGDCLTEINVTSPTGVQEVNALEDTCLEARVLERVEARVAEGRR